MYLNQGSFGSGIYPKTSLWIELYI
jgi:hypothetical protein